MSTAENLDNLNTIDGDARAGRAARPTIVPIGQVTRATDERLEREEREKREREELARQEAEAFARDENSDRLAYAINAVALTEYQRGRLATSRKGSWTIMQIKALLDALLDDDAPVVYPSFAKGALGGRSTLPMAAIERGLRTGAAAPRTTAPKEPPANDELAQDASAGADAYAADAPSSQSPTDHPADGGAA